MTNEELDRLTAPSVYALLAKPAPPPKPNVRTRDHKCGKCAWDGTGRVDCVNYRPSQTVLCGEADDGA